MAMASAFRGLANRAVAGLNSTIFVSTRHSATQSGSKKVSDRIVKLLAIDPAGNRHAIVGLTGHTLLKTLGNGGLIDPESHRLEDIAACSGECEVSISEEWLEKLPPPSEDELYVLKTSALRGQVNKHSRLGCQLILQPNLEGMVVAVPESKPWDIP